MARGGKVGRKHTCRNGVNLKRRRLEESDGDYIVSEDEVYESEDDYSSSLQDDASSSEEECVENKLKVGRSGLTRGSKRRKRDTVLITRKKKVPYDEIDDDDVVNVNKRKKSKLLHGEVEEDDDFEILCRQKKDGYDDAKRRKPRVVNTRTHRDGCSEKRRKKNSVSYPEQEEDDFYDSEEFTPDTNDLPNLKKKKVTKRRTKKRKRKGQVSKRTQNKRPVRKRVLRKKRRSGSGNKVRSSIVRKEKIIARDGVRRKNPSVDSDSDFVSSGSPDYGFTISEEEREQVREARELSRQLTSSLRTSNSSKVNIEEKIIPAQSDQAKRKGKEKVVETEIKEGQQVCGICLSGEGKKTVRGILSCCSHYFCFACIIEWSKVESRCPLCKQRFASISRSARADSGHHLRDAAIAVPERDQVYQPSEEEVRGFLDPYASVICSECQQGCDDSLMLLCDLCDSSAHTYCVGLGCEVPEGNWYCNACRPTVLASSNEQPVNLVEPNNFGSSSIAAVQESSYYEPDIYIGQLAGQSRPMIDSMGHSQVISPPGPGAATLLERRRIQRQIHQFLNNRNINLESRLAVTPISDTNNLGAQVPMQDSVQIRILPNSIYHQGSLVDHSAASTNCTEVHTPKLSSAVGLEFCSRASTSGNDSSIGFLSGEGSGISASVAVDLWQQQLQPCSGQPNAGVNASVLPSKLSEVRNSGVEKERVQSMVKHHLKYLSRNMEIGYNTFKDIARTSTHTVLATFGLEHRPREVYPVRTQLLICDHPERMTNQPTCLNREQCRSCLDRFVKNVVEEVLRVRVPTPCMC